MAPPIDDQYEQRTRVVFNLPVNERRQKRVLNDVLKYLKQQQAKHIGIDGFTQSAVNPPLFSGYWLSEKEGWLRESVVVFIVDYLLGLDDPRLLEELRNLKRHILELYERHQSKQEEVWVVAYRIGRVILPS